MGRAVRAAFADSFYFLRRDGPVIRVRLNESVEPLDEHTARNYFIQILLGVE